jgi:peroxiredoxin Q/BCP
MTLPKIGNKAPVFRLLNQEGREVKLTDFAGRYLVLYFYPKAMTPGCTTQACGLRDIAAELQQLNAAVIGISPDPVPRLKKFVEKEALNFDLLSDEQHLVAERYGVWGLKKFMGREFLGVKRMTFIIGPDGKLAEIMDKVKTTTHHSDVISWLRNRIKV